MGLISDIKSRGPESHLHADGRQASRKQMQVLKLSAIRNVQVELPWRIDPQVLRK